MIPSFNTKAMLTAFKSRAKEIILASENEKWYTTVDKIVDAQLQAWGEGLEDAGKLAREAEALVADDLERRTVCDPDQALRAVGGVGEGEPVAPACGREGTLSGG